MGKQAWRSYDDADKMLVVGVLGRYGCPVCNRLQIRPYWSEVNATWPLARVKLRYMMAADAARRTAQFMMQTISVRRNGKSMVTIWKWRIFVKMCLCRSYPLLTRKSFKSLLLLSKHIQGELDNVLLQYETSTLLDRTDHCNCYAKKGKIVDYSQVENHHLTSIILF